MEVFFTVVKYVLVWLAMSFSAFVAAEQSRILATPGAMQIEGAAGGGIVPWAVIGGYGHEGEWGVSAAVTRVEVDDFSLSNAAILIGIDNRLELSYAHQTLRLGGEGAGQLNQLSAGAFSSLTIEQDIFGLKLRLAGDLIYGAMPQVSAGVQYKINQNPEISTELLGAKRDTGTDFYVAASKLYLDVFFERNLLLNATLRRSKANQTGLLGFGGPDDEWQWLGEYSAALLLDRHWAVGVEYRQKPELLDSVEEDAWADAFFAWFPNKRVTVVAAYADLGTIALWQRQRGWYLSLQVNH